LPLVAVSASAQPSELFISEYAEGSSNNKAIEIYNGTGAPVDLAAAGYNIQMFFKATPPGLTINLTGVVAPATCSSCQPGDRAVHEQADRTNGWFNGDDAGAARHDDRRFAFPSGGFDAEWGRLVSARTTR
jgi:predicted extracellular nuclease